MTAACMLASAAAAQDKEPIRIGEINSYTALPAFTEPYRKGWVLAVEEINAAGGVMGRPLEVISRDDGGKPGNAVTIAEELMSREEVDMLAGTFFSHIGLAVADFAAQKEIVFVAAEPLTDAIVWGKGNRYTFRLRPSTFVQAAMLAREAAEMQAKSWATIAPNYKYGQDAVAVFKEELKKLKPDVEFVDEQWPALGKIDAGVTVRALEQAKPDAIYNVTFGGDLAAFVREGNLRGLFEGREVVSLLTGEPEYLEPLGSETPEGWIVTGYPWYDVTDKAHQAFVDAYQKRWDEGPKMGSIVGYLTFLAVKAGIEKAGSTENEALIKAFRGLTFDTPLGPVEFRASDHQSTMGAYVGRTALRDGQGVMVDWKYIPGDEVLPDASTVASLRPKEAME